MCYVRGWGGLGFTFFTLPHHRGRCSEGNTNLVMKLYGFEIWKGIGGMKQFKDGLHPSLLFFPLGMY